MSYQIKCDNFPILDLRDERLIVVSPKCKVETNTVGEASFTIYKTHPYYEKLKKLKSIFEISDEFGVIFRGRMTNDTMDFDNGKAVDLEGAMAFFNDSVVSPYVFPDDFLEDAEYIAASESGNVIEFFLKWLIDNHNSQVQEFQQFKLGEVTVSDPNNYLSRSDTNLQNTWDVLKSKLFDSALGGHLCIRYEDDGNYIDYLSEFTLTNTQGIDYGKNLLDLLHESDASMTYTAIIPIGAEIEVETEDVDESGNPIKVKKKLTLESIADGEIADDVYKCTLKNGLHAIYSKSAVEEYGWICAPISESTWDDVTDANNLLTKSISYLMGTAIKLTDTVEFTSVDLHFTDEQIRSFRIYRKIPVTSAPHGFADSFDLTKLDIDLLNPQNTKITVGETKRTLTDQNNKEQSETVQRIESAEKDIAENRTGVTEAKNMTITQSTSIINSCTNILMKALESYVETGNFEEYKETVATQLEIMAGEIVMNFTTTTEQITDIDGDMQAKFTEMYKYIRFKDGSLILGSSENNITLTVENDLIVFRNNNVPLGWWDGVDFHTGNIVVEVQERAQFGDFAFVPRSDGSLMFLKVAGEALVIIEQPSDWTDYEGSNAIFKIKASGMDLSYLWQHSQDEGATWNDASPSYSDLFSGYTTDTLAYSTSKLMGGSVMQRIRCIVSDGYGNSLISNEVGVYFES